MRICTNNPRCRLYCELVLIHTKLRALKPDSHYLNMKCRCRKTHLNPCESDVEPRTIYIRRSVEQRWKFLLMEPMTNEAKYSVIGPEELLINDDLN